MCYQKRLVYGHCNHSVPLGMAAPCPDKTECEGTRTHPLKTVRVEQMCPACKEKKVRVDNNLTTIAEKIRRLREELSKRGFGGTGSSTCPGPGSGVTSDAQREGTGSTAEKGEIPAGSENESRTVVTGASRVLSLSVPTTPTDAAIRRNDMFVGGVCLCSTSLTTISGKRLQ